ncbi:MAG: lipopolysaccharide heptosyltransferase I [Acidobacteria bacterium]|nr:lipopolysaccharide heptosyltransferase I [Acidobacteriota bacterium]
MRERILVVRLGSMGDIVHTLPGVATLREAFPRAHIDWLVERRWHELIELNPDISGIIPADTTTWRRELLRARTWRGFSELARTLRQAGYDTAIDFQGLYKSALLARLSGARERIGFDMNAAKESGAAAFYTTAVRPPENVHVIEMNLSLVKAAGAAEPAWRFPLSTQPDDEAYVEEQLQQNQVRHFFVLSPGGGWGSKCWPIERYAALHNALARTRGWRSVLNAGPGEERLASEFMAQARVTRPVHFPLTPRQLVALVRRARVLISGDTGPLHIAAAVGTPVVGLYGPTDPKRNGPFGSRAVVIHHRDRGPTSYKHEEKVSPAMLAITVEEVLAAVERAVKSSDE